VVATTLDQVVTISHSSTCSRRVVLNCTDSRIFFKSFCISCFETPSLLEKKSEIGSELALWYNSIRRQ
jgi:hypothetical protein